MVLFAYCLALLALYLQATHYSWLPILPFAPFLALLALLRPFSKTIGLACLAGITLDLFSSDPIGLHSMTYLLSAAFAYRFKSLFSPEHPTQFSLYTAIVSFSAILIQLALLFLFDRRVPFCGRWWLTDLPLLPLFDALYALIWFAGPLALFRILRRYWMVYWLKKNHSQI